MFKRKIPFILFATASAFSFAEHTSKPLEADQNIEEVFVTAEFREHSIYSTAASVSVLNEAVLIKRNAAHVEDILNLAPNVNFSTGASRGRFFLIRGVGERSQFKEPVNPSVGLMIDDIDFTGIGAAATTLDVKQVEVLRGPQGTLMGGNALAGFIQLKTEDAGDAFAGRVKVGAGNYDSRNTSVVISSPITDKTGIRIAAEQTYSDGFIKNTYLDREDTNNLDEFTGRVKVYWQPSDKWRLDFAAHAIDTDNGYDAFSLDNTRETLSDQPGKDSLEANAYSFSSLLQTTAGFDWKTSVSVVDADMEYSYDEDWSFPTICEGKDCDGWQYASVDQYLRTNSNAVFDSRFISNAGKIEWVAGIYYRNQSQELTRVYTYADSDFGSEYITENSAVYGELGFPIANNFKLVGGLRYETIESSYNDTLPQASERTDSAWGGKFSVEYTGFSRGLLYGLVSTGYKAGGYNITPNIPAQYREFDSEHMVNQEIGFKGQWLEGRVQVLSAVFSQYRTDVQTKQSYVTSKETNDTSGDCPCDFEDYLANAAEGSSYGLESEIVYLPTEKLKLWGNVGLLHAEYNNFISYSHVSVTKEEGIPYDMGGRQQPHAPSYQVAAGLEMGIAQNMVWSFDAELKDSFYFSASHNEKSEATTQFNTRVSFDFNAWDIAVWMKNITDETTETRGFYFGNDPRDAYAAKAYYQYGAPRTFGVTLSVDLVE